MVKIGMTRRLEPRDRIIELGDASVPLRHSLLMFHEDAVWLEDELHRLLDDRRVNRVNLRREFFYASPHEVRELLHDLDVALLEFVEEPEAREWRQNNDDCDRTDGGRPRPPLIASMRHCDEPFVIHAKGTVRTSVGCMRIGLQHDDRV